MPKSVAAEALGGTFYTYTLPLTLRPLSGFQHKKNKEEKREKKEN